MPEFKVQRHPASPADEIAALAELPVLAAKEIVKFTSGLHGAIADRAFDASGPGAVVPKMIHDTVSRAVYTGLAHGADGASTAVRTIARRLARRAQRAPSDTVAGSVALGAVNGLHGDALHRRGSAAALQMSLRHNGRHVHANSAELRKTYPHATPLLVVFVHGLSETDEAWGKMQPTYGTLLRDDLGYTTLYVRYNTGLHISENGREFAELLNDVVKGWPVPIDEIALIGHSMGGLVVRSACHQADVVGAAWVRSVRHIITLGTPHLGAPLEKGVAMLGTALSQVPETRPLARILNLRSGGIKDLRHGYLVEEDWLEGNRHDIPLLASARHYYVAATLARNPRGRWASIAGDLLVWPASAAGRRGQAQIIPFDTGSGSQHGGLHHFQLLNQPDVYAQIKLWLSDAPGRRDLAGKTRVTPNKGPVSPSPSELAG